MFSPDITVEKLNLLSRGCLVEHLDIVFTEVGPDYLKARMPVDHRTQQPHGLLHGGASVALAETLGSVGATACIDRERYIVAGQEINANHIRGAKQGMVYGTAMPIHTGRTSHVWEIKITDDLGNLVCISRMTVAILEKKKTKE
ncbi:MAG: hotdog fold thioesterase [Cyclobacteriaceae bacterium]|nr:hotdog fold thioesterase [Cyclobacteriaceae bacterium]